MLNEMGQRAKAAARILSRVSSEQKNRLLTDLADLLWVERSFILGNNQKDVEEAHQEGLSEALIDRLTLNADRLMGVAQDLRAVATLPDPIGEVIEAQQLDNGLRILRQRVPLGVLGVIYESRPNVTIDIAGLALKSGNAVILRGGSETLHSNRALVTCIHRVLEANGLPADAVQFIDSPDRSLVHELLLLSDYIDMIIPRGGARLHEFCREHSRIPVMTGGIGICHLYVDETANLEKSIPVIQNAKVQRPSVCNALDTLLVHEKVAPQLLPKLVQQLTTDGVRFRVHENAFSLLENIQGENIQLAGPGDFDQEWLALVLGVRVVESLEEAIEFIQMHSTGHSDGILTENPEHAQKFLSEVDSAAVYVNASTRFTDGGQLGLGAEVAVSTQRLHARGPMGLKELTTYKWIIQGQYHVRP
jgi:glutamate-5-semialdehyde dehydrogenase